MTFAPGPAEVRRARAELRRFLRDERISDELADRCLLVASELVTNALEASPPSDTIELAVTAADSVVTIEVDNVCDAVQEVIASITSVAMPPVRSDRGRGLPIVATAVTRLSITFRPGRIRVGADVVERS